VAIKKSTNCPRLLQPLKKKEEKKILKIYVCVCVIPIETDIARVSQYCS